MAVYITQFLSNVISERKYPKTYRSEARYLRWGEIFDNHLITNSLLSLVVEEL